MLQSAAGLSPVAVAAYRLLVGGLLATVIVAGQWRYLRSRAALWRLLVAGGLLAQFQAAYQVAVAQIAVSLATLITIGCVPVFVVVIGGVLERQVPAQRVLLAVGTAVFGLALLSGGAADVDEWQVVSGVVMSLFAGAGFAALTLVSARPLPGQHVVTSAGLLLGGLFLLPLAVADGMSVPPAGDVLALIGFLGVVPTALAYGSYFLGLRHAHPTAAALATMLEPLTATVLAVALHGERLTTAGVIGALLIAGALALYYLAPEKREG
jgi:DME family drug/metabolite transporter